MIRSFKHKGLRELAETGRSAKIGNMTNRVVNMIAALKVATAPEQMNIPGYKFHPLKGDRKGTYSVWVTGNYRITFGWKDGHAVDVDLEDYH